MIGSEKSSELGKADAPPPLSLNEPQARAVAHVDGPLLIFAGAGSGKTRVIVYRIANLVATHRVPPYRILAVTFTNKAAQEMKHRLEGLVGHEVAKDLWVGTFHATCARLLRTYHAAAGLERNFVIYDDADQRSLIGRVLKELELDEKRYPPRQILHRIHAAKQLGQTPNDLNPQSYVDDAVKKCFEAYERHKASANAVDFDDLLLSIMRLVENPESDAGEQLRRKFRYVLVDEFQDVNQVQYRIVRAVATTRNLCVVGDDDQSIYRWRGADVRIVRGFRRDFADAEVVKLEQNYRSTGHIVRSALSVIAPASDREPKELWTDNADGDRVRVVAAENEHDEAAFVAERIRELVRRGVSPREIAVFYRIHAQSRVLEEVMRRERIPYQIIGGMRFFERAEIKDCLSYLRVIDNPRSDVDLLRIINVPSRKIGDTTVDKLLAIADAQRSSLFDAIEPLVDSGQVGSQARNSLLGFRDLMNDLRVEARTAAPSVLCADVLERTGYEKMLGEDDTVEAETRKQNLRELVGSVLEYEQEQAAAGEVGTLSGYLERVTLSSDVDSLEETARVAMMTVHAAKGLEFTGVFLTGMEEDLFPFKSAEMRGDDDVEEERRLAYVAVTRARKELTITHTAQRMIFGRTQYGRPSRFLRDLPKQSIAEVTTDAARVRRLPRPAEQSGYVIGGPRPAWSHPQERARQERGRERPRDAEPVRTPGERYIEREAIESGGMHRGSRVRHDKFGIGVVESVDGGKDPIATVSFRGRGTIRIKASFLHFGED